MPDVGLLAVVGERLHVLLAPGRLLLLLGERRGRLGGGGVLVGHASAPARGALGGVAAVVGAARDVDVRGVRRVLAGALAGAARERAAARVVGRLVAADGLDVVVAIGCTFHGRALPGSARPEPLSRRRRTRAARPRSARGAPRAGSGRSRA